jgi:hypoxanthine-guanine phosphoribosyltransferase
LVCSKGVKNVLLVDDIIDQGHTIKEIHDHYWEMDTAVLIYNCVNRYSLVPTYAAWTINRQELPQWIDYWWEKV